MLDCRFGNSTGNRYILWHNLLQGAIAAWFTDISINSPCERVSKFYYSFSRFYVYAHAKADRKHPGIYTHHNICISVDVGEGPIKATEAAHATTAMAGDHSAIGHSHLRWLQLRPQVFQDEIERLNRRYYEWPKWYRTQVVARHLFCGREDRKPTHSLPSWPLSSIPQLPFHREFKLINIHQCVRSCMHTTFLSSLSTFQYKWTKSKVIRTAWKWFHW